MSQELIHQLESLDKTEFINLARKINIFKTKKEPGYLAVKQKIMELMVKFDLTENDLMPLPKFENHQVYTTISSYKFNK